MKNTNSLPTLLLKKIVHRKCVQLLLLFKYNDALKEKIKQLDGYKWSQTLKGWYTAYSLENLLLLKDLLKNEVQFEIDSSIDQKMDVKPVLKKPSISACNKEIIRLYIKYLKGKRYSESTIDTYSVFIRYFLEYIKEKPLEMLTNRDVELFVEDVFIPRGYSISTHRQFISAMKLFKAFYPESKIEEINLERPRKSRYLPVVLSQQEVLELLRCTKNLKHRTILALLYSCGLRVGELIHLELRHIDVQRNQIAVKNSKGRKDRYVNMGDSLKPLINNYIQTYKPTRYFAEGKPSMKYSAESIRKFLKKSCQLAKIRKKVTPHTLRHTYATHLLENGTDIRLIQTLLGHSKPETTMIYTHVSTQSLDKITSPLDIAVKKYLDVNGSIKPLPLNSNDDM